MYVRKFEGDSLEEALRGVKQELGPDAIILKTVNNKGLRSAFKKKKFEITAAISENSYVRKAKVDRVLTTDQKQKFYNSDAGHVSKMINKYNGNDDMVNESKREVKTPPRATSGYGGLGLNKVVSSISKSGEVIKDATTKTSNKIRASLDEFLSAEDVEQRPVANVVSSQFEQELNETMNLEETMTLDDSYGRDTIATEVQSSLPRSHREEELSSSLKSQQQKIETLENQLFELTKAIHTTHQNEQEDETYQLRKTLKTLDIDEVIIQRILKKASFELSREDLCDQDILFEFALRELNSSIRVGMPLFSKATVQNESVFTVLLSEVSSGQTSMALKLGRLCEDSIVITYNKNNIGEENNCFAIKMLNLNVVNATSISEIISLCRQANEKGQKVIIDFKGNGQDADETKKFIEALSRSFNNIEVLVTLSAIHSEVFNRKIIAKYQEFATGVIISHIDLCLNFGALVNLQTASENIEFKFYGTGNVIPEDIEAATSERILAGMFQF
jgi:flagellar biosynthesis protein FlhF